jgi:penicillin-insensitive murein endopeptidase
MPPNMALLALTLIAALSMACEENRPAVSSAAPPQGISGGEASPQRDAAVEGRGPELASRSLDWQGESSVSLRNPNDGSLQGGVALPPEAPGLLLNPARESPARYGTVEVVRALLQAAERVQRETGGLGVTIHDLSYENGGPIPHHGSHQSGRDVDVLFYQLGPDGQPIRSVGAFFNPAGEGVDFRDLADPADDVPLKLDVARSWLFVRSLIEQPDSSLQRIFVAEHIRSLLLQHAQAAAEPAALIERFAQMTCQPSYPHDDHFHFRFFCQPDDIVLGCRDSDPIYPWWREHLEQLGVEPKPLLPRRPTAEAKVVTHEEARRAAGPLDEEVERWLEERKRWLEAPRTGREYCR